MCNNKADALEIMERITIKRHLRKHAVPVNNDAPIEVLKRQREMLDSHLFKLALIEVINQETDALAIFDWIMNHSQIYQHITAE